jgi:hypothetical protein
MMFCSFIAISAKYSIKQTRQTILNYNNCVNNLHVSGNKVTVKDVGMIAISKIEI